jgi:hypothetical protein
MIAQRCNERQYLRERVRQDETKKVKNWDMLAGCMTTAIAYKVMLIESHVLAWSPASHEESKVSYRSRLVKKHNNIRENFQMRSWTTPHPRRASALAPPEGRGL